LIMLSEATLDLTAQMLNHSMLALMSLPVVALLCPSQEGFSCWLLMVLTAH
jgi:hypothetical protein